MSQYRACAAGSGHNGGRCRNRHRSPQLGGPRKCAPDPAVPGWTGGHCGKPPIKCLRPTTKLGSWLHRALIRERRLTRAQHPPHRVAGQVELPGNLLDRLAVDKVRPPDPGNRIHNQHLPHHPTEWVASSQIKGGQFWTPITPRRGSNFHAVPQSSFLTSASSLKQPDKPTDPQIAAPAQSRQKIATEPPEAGCIEDEA